MTEPQSANDRIIRELGQAARAAGARLARAGEAERVAAIRHAAARIRDSRGAILEANARDLDAAEARGLTGALIDRLKLDDVRVEAMAAGLETVAEQPDPVGRVLAGWERPNGLRIERVSVPLGVIAIIYESRPNVTADAAGLCLRAGNAVILRGGSESAHSSAAIAACVREGLRHAGLPEACVQMMPGQDRALVGALLRAGDLIDVVVPRGGKSLIARVQEESRIPVLAHLDGICHVYIHAAADPKMAVAVPLNAKMRRTGICGAMETLLVDETVAAALLPPAIAALRDAGCELRGDDAARVVDPSLLPATEEDWRTEYLDAILSIRVVHGVDEAIDHINTYGSHHTDSILTEDSAAAERFLSRVDSAIVLHNASTQFADGGEFGMGAEIGIATGRLHARGPVGAEQLTTYQYRVRGAGQCRP